MATLSPGRRRPRAPWLSPMRAIQIGLVVALVSVGLLWLAAARWAPDRQRYPVQGIAVSAGNGRIDWPVVAAGRADFAYVRATNGVGARDPEFARNWAGAREAGLRYGAVHQYDLCRPAADQARQYLATVPRDSAALPPVVALEGGARCTPAPSRDQLLSQLNIFLNAIEAHSGKPAILRLSRDVEDTYAVSRGINRTVWLTSDALPPTYASHDWVLWTANSWRRIQGIDGTVEWTVVRS